MDYKEREYQGLANAIINLAEALRDGRHAKPRAAAKLLRENAETFLAWTDELDEGKTYDHDPRPDDMPEPGDRCKDCGEPITWVGPSMYHWMHVDDERNR